MIDIILISLGILALIAATFFLMYTGASDREVIFQRLFHPSDFKLSFSLPFKYRLGEFGRSFTHSQQTRKITIYGKITTWYGELIVDVKEDGLWGYKTFLLKGIGTSDGFHLKPNTDVLEFLAEGRTFSRIFLEHGIMLEYDSSLGTKIRDIESKINNLKVMERKHLEKYGPKQHKDGDLDDTEEDASA